eukprot:3598137-Alexandrium_andersonii.AAC.1
MGKGNGRGESKKGGPNAMANQTWELPADSSGRANVDDLCKATQDRRRSRGCSPGAKFST